MLLSFFDKKKYILFNELLKDLELLFREDKKIRNALEKYSEMEYDELINFLYYNSPNPRIIITSQHITIGNHCNSRYGHFNILHPDCIYINETIVLDLEYRKKYETALALIATLFHLIVHYLKYIKKKNFNEQDAISFENNAFASSPYISGGHFSLYYYLKNFENKVKEIEANENMSRWR